MLDSTKVIIGLGFVAIILYGLTILPSCIFAVWFQKYAGTWLITLSPITAFGFIYQVIAQHRSDGVGTMARGITFSLIAAAIPGFIGALLLRAER
jgi:hypothetical protein